MVRAKVPDLDSLPTFADVINSFRSATRQCVWYVPASERKCSVEISIEDLKTVFRLAQAVRQAESADLVADTFLQIIKHICCDQYHRDLIQNSGLNQKLALKWQADFSEKGVNGGPSASGPQLTEIVDRKLTLRSASTLIKRQTASETESEDGEVSSVKECALDTKLSKLLSNLKISEASHFRPYKRLPDENVASKLKLRLSKRGLEAFRANREGNIYLFTQKIFPGMVKIGYTNDKTEKRLGDWSKCGHGYPDIVKIFEQVPCAERVELLIHFELLEFWRRERYCKGHGSSHTEWFEVPDKDAATVAARWVEWMRCARPYNDNGDLSESWKSIIEEMEIQGINIDATLLLALHEEDHGSGSK